MATRPITVVGTMVAAVSLAAGAYALGRASGGHGASGGCGTSGTGTAETAAAVPMRVEAGSIFRNRFATADSPLDGTEAVLLSGRQEECLEGCPLALRLVGGEKGAAALQGVLASLHANVELLLREPGLPADIRGALQSAFAELADKSLAPASVPGDAVPARALLVRMPRPDEARSAWSAGFALYDHADAHFDAIESPDEIGEGARIVVCRVEEPQEEEGPCRCPSCSCGTDSGDASARTHLLAGAIEIGRFRRGAPTRLPKDAMDLGYVFGSLWNHFRALPGEACGLHLARDGKVSRFGSDRRLVPFAASDGLRRALVALLRRA